MSSRGGSITTDVVISAYLIRPRLPRRRWLLAMTYHIIVTPEQLKVANKGSSNF